MSEILRYTTAEAPRDIVNDEGDVLPYSSEAAESARDLQGALELQDQQYLEQVDVIRPSAVEMAVMDALHSAALAEGRLRKAGASMSRIKGAHIKLEQDLIELQLKGHDISGAFVPEVAKDQGASTVPNSEHAAEEARDAKIEHLMDTMGISYEEAEKE